MRKWIVFALSLYLLLTTGLSLSAQDSQRQTLYIGPARVFCSGALRIQKCYQVKDSPDADYQNLFVSIEGFDYVPGFDYQIEVEVTPIENAPADTPRASYRLIQVLSQQRSLTDTTWILDSYQNTQGETVDALPDREVYIKFDGQNINGNAGCNFYGGTYTLSGDHIQIGALISTMMACADNGVMDQEAAYHGLLSQAELLYDCRQSASTVGSQRPGAAELPCAASAAAGRDFVDLEQPHRRPGCRQFPARRFPDHRQLRRDGHGSRIGGLQPVFRQL